MVEVFVGGMSIIVPERVGKGVEKTSASFSSSRDFCEILESEFAFFWRNTPVVFQDELQTLTHVAIKSLKFVFLSWSKIGNIVNIMEQNLRKQFYFSFFDPLKVQANSKQKVYHEFVDAKSVGANSNRGETGSIG